MLEMPKITSKEEFEKAAKEYKVKYDRLEELLEAKDPSVNHWRLNAEVNGLSNVLLEYIRNNVGA